MTEQHTALHATYIEVNVMMFRLVKGIYPTHTR